MSKSDLYEEFISRMKTTYDEQMFLESSWYAYSVLEDRLRSMLKLSKGGEYKTEPKKDGTIPKNKKMIMMGPKIAELKFRAQFDSLIDVNFERLELVKWSKRRNKLMHAMASGELSIEDVDAESKSLAEKGKELVRLYSASTRRIKKHRHQVSI